MPRENQYICTNENRRGPTLKIAAVSSKNDYNNKKIEYTITLNKNKYSKPEIIAQDTVNLETGLRRIKIGEVLAKSIGKLEDTDKPEVKIIINMYETIQGGKKKELGTQTLKFYLMKCEENYKEVKTFNK